MHKFMQAIASESIGRHNNPLKLQDMKQLMQNGREVDIGITNWIMKVGMHWHCILVRSHYK